MSDVVIKKSHSLGVDGAKEKIGAFEELLNKYRVKIIWSGNKGTLKGTGVSGDVALSDTEIGITIKLGFLAKAAGVKPDKLKGSIEKRLDAAING